MLQPTRYRGRFAPTPSGKMHIGNALAALLGWLQMRSCGGQYILRIEDIDEQRSREELIDELMRDLHWLGLDWDEGPDAGGTCGPYRQTERKKLYEEALAKLQQAGLLYPCYCSRADIMAAASAPHGLASEGRRYPGTCRHLTAAEARQRAQGKKPALRMKVPASPITFTDEVAGPQTCFLEDSGDFVVRRADGMFSYQLAVVVDDALMGITHVLRGADLLDSTPRQLLLYEALGYRPPRFAHVPLLVSEDGRRLAKRSGGLALSSLREQGVEPQRIVGWLAWAAGLIEAPEPAWPSELIRSFDIARIGAAPVKLTSDALQKLLGP